MTDNVEPPSDEYMGWTNRETWCTSLWLNNDEHLCEGLQSILHSCKLDKNAAHAVKVYIESVIDDADVSGFMSDALKAFSHRVNWLEIVECSR